MSRQPWVYRFTLADIAMAAAVHPDEVKSAKRRKELDPRDFASVVRYVMVRRIEAALP